MEIKLGDIVEVIDEDLSGEVIAIEEDYLVFASADGFEYRYHKSAVFCFKEGQLIHSKEIVHSSEEFIVEDKKVENHSHQLTIVFSGKIPVFDLHLEELAPQTVFSNLHDALIFQLEYAEAVLSQAARKRIRRFVFVHGVGKGVLRKELRNLLKEKYTGVEFFDGNYSKFGAGATEIIIHDFSSIK